MQRADREQFSTDLEEAVGSAKFSEDQVVPSGAVERLD